MTMKDGTKGSADLKTLVASDPDFVRVLVRTALQEVLEAEMSDALGAAKGERTESRLGYRAGYYGRTLITRVGKLELRVPQDREGRFSTELFERYQPAQQAPAPLPKAPGPGGPGGRSERALVAALAEMYVQGVSTRKVKAITEELCGHRFSASSISAINKRLDASLAEFANRRLEEPYPYLILDARYERVREAGVIRSQAVLIAVAIGWDGRRSVLGVELANRAPAGARSMSRGPAVRRRRRPGEPLKLARLSARPARAKPSRCRTGRGRRPRWAQGGPARSPAGGDLSTLLCALSEECARLRAAPVSSADIPPGDRAKPDGRRRLLTGAPPADVS